MSFKPFGPRTRPSREKPPPSPPSPPSPINAHPKPARRGSNASFTSATSNISAEPDFHDARFPAEEEVTMITASNTIKSDANKQFSNSDFEGAISTYDRALSELPSYLDYEMAVLQSNIAACYVKLEKWKEAIESSERGLEGLEREMPTEKKKKGEGKEGKEGKKESKADRVDVEEESKVVELPSDAEDKELEQKLKELDLSDERKRDITRIRTKLLLRRARAKASMEPPSWSYLGGALEDYQMLSQAEYFSTLPTSDQKTVRLALVTLPPRVNEAKDKEMGEMMGKLKELGNGILKPFGLSTDMFKMTQGADGGWSMSIDQNGGKKS